MAKVSELFRIVVMIAVIFGAWRLITFIVVSIIEWFIERSAKKW